MAADEKVDKKAEDVALRYDSNFKRSMPCIPVKFPAIFKRRLIFEF